MKTNKYCVLIYETRDKNIVCSLLKNITTGNIVETNPGNLKLPMETNPIYPEINRIRLSELHYFDSDEAAKLYFKLNNYLN